MRPRGGGGGGGGGKVAAEGEGAGEAGREGEKEGGRRRGRGASDSELDSARARSLAPLHARALPPSLPAPSHPGPPHPPPLAQGLLEPGGARCRFQTDSAGSVPSLRNRPRIRSGGPGRPGG